MPRDLSGDNIMLTFSVSLVFLSLLKVLDSCTVQEISMVNGSASEVLQTCVLYRGLCMIHELPLVDGCYIYGLYLSLVMSHPDSMCHLTCKLSSWFRACSGCPS